MNKNLMIFLLAYLNVHYLILLSMGHEYAYFYEYIWKMVYWKAVQWPRLFEIIWHPAQVAGGTSQAFAQSGEEWKGTCTERTLG